MAGPRGEVDFVKVNHIPIELLQLEKIPDIQNFLIETDDPNKLWLKEATGIIGEWRGRLRSTYIRWALAINGLNVAALRYGDPGWASTHKFQVRSVRPVRGIDPDGRTPVDRLPIAEWDGATAAKNHMETLPMLAAFGIIDIYANLESLIFSFYRIFLNHHPESIIQGPEFRDLRKLRRDPEKAAEWKVAWELRLNKWHRNKLYDGIAKVFTAFCSVAKLKTPSIHSHATLETWAETLDMISVVRNCLIHGESIVPENLAEACKKPHALLFDFKTGAPFEVRLDHLEGVEFFCDQLLTGINITMLELHFGERVMDLARKPEPPASH